MDEETIKIHLNRSKKTWYICTICNYTCAYKFQMTEHFKKEHGYVGR